MGNDRKNGGLKRNKLMKFQSHSFHTFDDNVLRKDDTLGGGGGAPISDD